MPPCERRIVPLIAVCVVALHLVFAGRYGWFRDELYYVACGRRLALGYVDHPPIVALVARFANAIFGDSLVGLRSFAAIAAGGAILLGGALARAFGGGRVAQIVAALGVALAPYDLVVGHIYTMNGFEPLAWGGIALVVARAIRDDETKRLVWLGPIVGLGVLNKQSASWPVLAIILGLAASPSRKLLARRETWIAAGIAIVIVAPHVAWQVHHGFPTREFARAALTGKNEPYGPLGLLGQLFQLFHPLLAPLWIAGLVGLLGWRPLRPYRPFGVAVLLLVLLVFGTQAKAYYLGPAWMWLFAAGGVVTERAMRTQLGRRLVVGYGVLTIVAAFALMPVAMPILDEETFERYARALGVLGEQRSGEKMRPSRLPQHFADMDGWPELASTVRNVVEGLAPSERADAIIMASNYGQASAIEHFGAGAPVGSGDNGWWLWGPPRPAPSVIVWVGSRSEDLRDLFADVREVARADHPLARADEREIPVSVCREPKLALAEAWPRLKHYR
jgi:4-amino-4-deoxy-L-arabinose transferase-like glycosyltransferase